MQVLEIKDTGSDYFERVLLFVKPEYYNIDKDKLQKQAWNFTQSIGMPPPVRKKDINWKAATAKAAAAIVVGLVLSLVIVNL